MTTSPVSRRLSPVRLTTLAGLLWLLASLPAAADLVTAISRSATPLGTANQGSEGPLWDRNGRFAAFRASARSARPGVKRDSKS